MANNLSFEKQVRVVSALAEDSGIRAIERMTGVLAIRRLHGCESRHIESVPIHEEFRGQTVWSGTVEVFELTDHPKAKVCYAWGHHTGKNDKQSRYVIVLGIPPVDSPVTAVRASIAFELKK
jgi:hypothetical protein